MAGTNLREIVVLAIDCQASGTTPAHGDLLELAWAACSADALPSVASRWIVPRTARPVSRAIRELTGWTEACLDQAVPEGDAWSALEAEVVRLAGEGQGSARTVIHYARFELPFLRDLQARLGADEQFP